MSITQTLGAASTRAAILERDEGMDGVTIGIPCFNHGQYIREAVESAFAQTVPPVEVIVVNDGSTEEIMHHIVDFPVRYIRVSNRGLPGARNTALMNAKGRAFLPLDADDWIEPTYIQKTLPLLKDVVVTGLQEHGTRNGLYRPGCDLGMDKLTVEAERASNRLFYCSLFRTSLLREVGGYNGKMTEGYEDWDLWVDLMQRGATITALDEPLFHYRTRADSMLANVEKYHREDMLNEMARHHGYSR